MRPWLLLLICASLSSSCQKTETNPPQVELGYYPHVERFTGTFHVVHSIHYIPPDIDYDSIYQQTIEVIYPDSNWVSFNFSFWDIDYHDDDTYVPKLTTETVSFLKRPDNHYTFDSSRHYLAHLRLAGDSLWMDKYVVHPPDESLSVSFNGKK